MTCLENYNDRLNRVLDHVYANLEEDLSFDRLAEVACLSPYHWSRIYSAMRGETIVATIRRLRLQRAADRLANSELDIDAIGARAGYGSPDTFGRAFKSAFGMSPAAYREKGSHAAFRAANAAGAARAFPVVVERVPERRCAGIDHTGSYMEIDHAMGRLFTTLAARDAIPAEPAMIGVFFDDPDIGPECRKANSARIFTCLSRRRSEAEAAHLLSIFRQKGQVFQFSLRDCLRLSGAECPCCRRAAGRR